MIYHFKVKGFKYILHVQSNANQKIIVVLQFFWCLCSKALSPDHEACTVPVHPDVWTCCLDLHGDCFQVTLATNGSTAAAAVEEEPRKSE